MILGERVRLRPVEKDDLPRFVRWFGDPELRRYLAAYLPLGYAQEEKWYERNLDRGPEQAWALEVRSAADGETWALIGSCGLHEIHWRTRAAELGIAIGDRAYWGQGYGTDAVRALIRWGFETVNLNRIFLRVFADNPRAIRAYEKAGFIKEGALRQDEYHEGQYVDTLVMGILREEWLAARSASAGT